MTAPVTRRAALRAVGTVVAGAAVAGCGGDGGDGPTTIDMTDQLVFDPEQATVAVGETVTWENVGSIGHTVTADGDQIPEGAAYFASGGYDSEQAARDAYNGNLGGNVPGGERYEHTFEVAGTYEYVCIPHETSGMVGTLVVEE